MTNWTVGDLAVCVADRLPAPRDVPTKLLRIGAVYRVTSVRWSVGEQCVAIGLKGVRSRGPLGDWHASIFRKIVKADIDFIEQMRALGPKVDA